MILQLEPESSKKNSKITVRFTLQWLHMTAQGYLSFPDARIIGVPNRISNSRKRGRFSHNAGTNVGVVRGVRVLEERDPGEASLSAEKRRMRKGLF